MENKDLGKCSTGMQPNVAGLLCYLFGWITGLIFILIEKENKFVRFHALQSIMVSGGLMIIQIALAITMVGIAFIPIVGLAQLVLWILMMIKAYQGELFKLPLVGDIAQKNA